MADLSEPRYAIQKPLDPYFVETYRIGPNEKKVRIVRASRWIVLSKDDPQAGVENAVKVANGEHLLVFGDRVRVAGPIELRGLNVTIKCRELEFAANSKGNPTIDVTGEDGNGPNPTGVNTTAAATGENGKQYETAGKPGRNGKPGSPGNSGRQGGIISIVCDNLKPLAPVILKADGGNGYDGIRGQDGGTGGNGLDNIKPGLFEDLSGALTEAARGGRGGIGGNGGDGGQGGDAGTINLLCRHVEKSSHAVTLSVAGGNGGKGGPAGNGGTGGKGGTPGAGALQAGERGWYVLANGADSGGGNAPGVPGFGGGCGKPGTLKLRCIKEALRYPSQKFLQENTGSLRLICKSGALGSDCSPGTWGGPGEPGNGAAEGSSTVPGPDGPQVRYFSGSGKSGNKTGTDPTQAPSRTAPDKQQPIQRTWEVWEGDAPAPIPASPALPRAPMSPGPRPEPTPLSKNLEAQIQTYLKNPKLYGAQLKSVQRQLALLQQQFNQESQRWTAAERTYEQEKDKYEKDKYKYEEEKNKYPELVKKVNADHTTRLTAGLKDIWEAPKFKEDIAAGQDGEQLQMLYDLARTRYLFAPPGGALPPHLGEQVSWLVNVAEARVGLQLEDGTIDAAMHSLYQAASSIYGNLWSGKSIFGHIPSDVVLGTPEKYEDALQKMTDNLKSVDKYNQLTTRFDQFAQSWSANWSQVKDATDSVVGVMEQQKTEITKSGGLLSVAMATIKEREAARGDMFEKLKKKSNEFADEINTKIGLKPEDFFGMLNQLSFTNREFHNQAGKFLAGGAVAAGAMLASQAGEMATKAMDNVITDTGETINKKYLIRSVKTLTAKLPNITDLKQARDGVIAQDPNAEARLLATEEQLNSILENFYEQSEKARGVSSMLDAYVDAAQQRNAAVDEWNEVLALYAYCNGEIQKAKAQSAAIDEKTSNDPGLPAMARWHTALNRHALEKCIETLYDACLVYKLHRLEDFNVYSNLGGAIDGETGVLNHATLKTLLNDYIFALLKLTKSHSDRSTMQGVEFEIMLQTEGSPADPSMPTEGSLEYLKTGGSATFTVPAADPRAILPKSSAPDPSEPARQRNPFAGNADIRLTHIVPSVFLENGNELREICSDYTIKLTHSGMETFYRPAGIEVFLTHDPMTKAFTYKEGVQQADSGALSDEYSKLIGPFCRWEISIPHGNLVYKRAVFQGEKNLGKLKSIKILFKGEWRAFLGSAVEMANQEARAIAIDVSDDTFKQAVLDSAKPIVVDFRAKKNEASPALERMRTQVMRYYTGRVKFAVIELDKNKKTHDIYKIGITKLPSMLAFSGGNLLQVLDGSIANKDIRSFLSKVAGQTSSEAGLGAGAGA